MTPMNDGVRLDDRIMPAQGFTEAELDDAMYHLTADADQAELLVESCDLDMADDMLNPGESLIVEAVSAVKNRIDRTMSALVRVFNRFSNDVAPYDYPSIGPDRKNALFAYKTVTFTFDDGQTVSILFHAPGSDPKKIKPTDTLIAYRWMLNRRDITAIVSPERGRDLNLQLMAKRIMQLVEKNSDKFKANNEKRQEQKEKLETLEGEQSEANEAVDRLTQQNADLSEQVETADARIERLQSRLADMGEGDRDGSGAGAESTPDQYGMTPADRREVADNKKARAMDDNMDRKMRNWIEAGAPGPLEVEKARARDLGGGLVGFYVVDPDGNVVDSGPVYASGKGATQKAREDAQSLLKTLEVIQSDVQNAAQDGTGNPAGTEAGDSSQSPVAVEVGDVAEMLPVDVTDIGDENVYFTKDGQRYFFKPTEADDYELGELATMPDADSSANAPRFSDYDEALEWVSRQSSERGMTEQEFRQTDQYQQVRDHLMELYEQKMSAPSDNAGQTVAEQNAMMVERYGNESPADDIRSWIDGGGSAKARPDWLHGPEKTSNAWYANQRQADKAAQSLADRKGVSIATLPVKSSDPGQYLEGYVLAELPEGIETGSPGGNAERVFGADAQSPGGEKIEAASITRPTRTPSGDEGDTDPTKDGRNAAAQGLRDLDEGLFRDIGNAIGTIKSIDNGDQPGMNRSAFTSSITNKLKTQMRNGNEETVDAALRLLAQQGEENGKPILAKRSGIWKATGHDMDYYMNQAQGGADAGEQPPSADDATGTGDGNPGQQEGGEVNRISEALQGILQETDSGAAIDALEKAMDDAEAAGIDIDNDPDVAAASDHVTALLEKEAA